MTEQDFINSGFEYDDEMYECPKCGSDNVIQDEETLIEYKCLSCGYKDEEDIFKYDD